MNRKNDSLQQNSDDIVRKSVFEIFGPLAFEFVRWVITQAKQYQIKRLYFLARDGWFFYLFSKELAKQWAPELECKYFYCSRTAVRIPLYHQMEQEEYLTIIFAEHTKLSAADYLKRAGIPAWKQQELLKQAGWAYPPEQSLSQQEYKRLRTLLSDCEAFHNLVRETSESAYNHAVQYLKQEQMHEPRAGIVDSGWLGSMQKSLCRLLCAAGYETRLHGFYFGMYQKPDNDQEYYHTFYFNGQQGMSRKLNFNNNVFEAVFSSPEGMTTGYNYSEAIRRYLPVMEENPNQKELLQLETCFLDYLQQKIKETGISENFEIFANSQKQQFVLPFEGKLRDLMIMPSREEAAFFGSFSFSDDSSGAGETALAMPLSRKVLYQALLPGILLRKIGLSHKEPISGAWLEGSIAILPGRKRMLRLICRLTKYIRYKIMEIRG